MITGRRTLPAGLVILGIATGIGVGPSLGQSLGDPISAKAADDHPRGNPLWSIPVKTLTATRDRPIFSPSRRPPPSPVIAAPQVLPPPVSKPTEPERPPLTLVGTVTGEQEAFGIFLDQTANKIVRLRLGDDHYGWILRQVRGREVMLQKDGETAFLALPPPGSKPAVARTQVADEPERRRFSR
jgi:general secretion pathway protein N